MQNRIILNPDELSEKPADGGRKSLLLADDSRFIRSMYSRALREAGFHVVEVCGGLEAQRAAEEAGHFDLLLTDYLMPGMNGGHLATWFHQRQPRTGVLVYSASPECVAFASRNLPFAACMASSTSIADFIDCVKKLLAQDAGPLPASALP